MKRNHKLLILPLMLGLLSANLQVQAETIQGNETLTTDKRNAFFPTVLIDKSNNAAALVKREDLIAALSHCIGESPNEKAFSSLDFLDKESVSPDLRGYFTSACKLQIFSGVSSNDGFLSNPLQVISKEEAATMIGKTLGFRSTEATGYADESNIAPWALPYVAGLKQSHLLWDTTESFLPKEPLTWGELTACLQYAADSQKLVLPDVKVLLGNSQKSETKNRPDIYKPMGITRDETGTIYIADSGNSMIASADNGKSVKTYAGSESPRNLYKEANGTYADGGFLESGFSRPTDVLMTGSGLLAADMGNNSIRLLSDNTVFTYAGCKTAGHLDGYRLDALFNAPSAIALDDKSNVYISDTLNHCIRKIDPKGMVTTIAGTAKLAGFQDGEALSAKLSQPRGLAFKDGVLYIADSGNQRIRAYQDGMLTTVAGGGEETYENTDVIMGDYADGPAKEARFNDPQGIAFGNDSMYITDAGNSMIRKYQNGQVTTVVGVGLPINALDNQTANLLCQPVGILALENQLIVSDQFTNHILSISLQ